MAQTGFTTNSPEAVKLWSEQLFRDVLIESYFSRFMQGGSSGIVHVKNDFEKQAGDRMTFGIRMRLQGNGVTEGQTLEGNEEALTTYTFNLTLAESAHAVRDNGPMSRQRAMFDISQESEQSLRDWGTEKIDKDCFTAALNAPTKAFYAGSASSTATLTTSDKITPALLTKMAAWAKTGGNRAYVPFRPVRVEGGDYYVLIIHPDAGYDLRTDSTWIQAKQYADIRGADNAIFTGALGVWSNVIVHEHERIPLTTNYGSGANVPGCQSIFMGAQALAFGWGRKPKIIQKTFDYDRQIGFGLSMIYATAKPNFNSKDYGSMALYTARTQVS